MAQPATSEKGEEEALPAETAAPKPSHSWLPAIAVVVLVPLISIAVAQFVLIPRLKGVLGAAALKPGSTPHAEKAAATPAKGKNGEELKPISYPFDNIVVNLSGAKGTRYLKTAFMVVSSNQDAQKILDAHKSELLDVTIGVLSAKSLTDLEDAGAHNTVRNELIENFNQALKSNLIEQVYFTEFVIQ